MAWHDWLFGFVTGLLIGGAALVWLAVSQYRKG